MGKDSDIEWTHHTFNPWWGCTKVSPACANCYAESWAKRVGYGIWGGDTKRRFFTDKHWKEPLLWNEEAKKLSKRYRVFCASMGDVFENRQELKQERLRLWKLIEQTPHLDWLLLTKRPQNIEKMAPWSNNWPENVWLGTTVENQTWADKRLPHLLKHKAAVRFLSCEPLLGQIDLAGWHKKKGLQAIDWVIAGGESGPKARPMHPEWLRSLRDFCRKNQIAFHFKQWGHWIPESLLEIPSHGKRIKIEASEAITMVALGKKEAGRILDGRTYDEVPLEQAA